MEYDGLAQKQYHEDINNTSADKWIDHFGRSWFRINTDEFGDLEKYGKINAIKHLRAVFGLGLGLGQAKELIDIIAAHQRQTKAKDLLAEKLRAIVDEAYRDGFTKTEVWNQFEKNPIWPNQHVKKDAAIAKTPVTQPAPVRRLNRKPANNKMRGLTPRSTH